jgi:hypothetical protein
MTPEQQKAVAIARARARVKAKANVAPEGFYQQKGKGGLADYLPEPVTNAMQRLGDITTSAQDATTRGFLTDDKMVDEARTRAGNATVPGDIIASIVASPYRVASVGAGALTGGLEGAASAYGHQKNWMPNLQEGKDILYEGAKGAALGSGAAKGAEWLGKGINALRGKPPYSTADELADAAAQADRRTRGGRDTLARDARMKAAEIAQAEGPGGFQKLRESMDRPMTLQEKTFPEDYPPRIDWPHKEKVQATKLAHPKSPEAGGNYLQKGLRLAGSVAEGGGGLGKLGPVSLLGGNVLAPLFKAAGAVGDVSPQNWQDMQRLILDSTGKLKTDKATVDLLRNYLSKTVVQGGKGERVPPPW